jgi:hypothetical protein
VGEWISGVQRDETAYRILSLEVEGLYNRIGKLFDADFFIFAN